MKQHITPIHIDKNGCLKVSMTTLIAGEDLPNTVSHGKVEIVQMPRQPLSDDEAMRQIVESRRLAWEEIREREGIIDKINRFLWGY